MSFQEPRVPPTPDTYTPVSKFGAVLIDALNPWMTLHLAWVCDAIGVMVDPWYELVMDQGVDDGTQPTVGTYVNGQLVTTGYAPGYSKLLDPTRCPPADLPYLGQFVGVAVPAGSDETTARSLVEAEAGLNRGTDTAVIAAAKRNLTGTQSVTLIPRTYVDGTPDAFWQGMILLSGEVTDLAKLEADVLATAFGGILMWFKVVSAYTWAQAVHTWAGETMTWAQAASTQP